MGENWLSNRIFKFYGDLVAQWCDAWRELKSSPWRIMSHWPQRVDKWVLISETYISCSLVKNFAASRD